MTAVSITYIIVAPEGFKLSTSIGYPVGIIGVIVILGIFLQVTRKKTNEMKNRSEVA